LAFLALGVLLVVFMFFGRFLVLLFRRGAADEPKYTATVRAHTITGRERVPLYVDSVGPREQFSLILCHGWGVTSDVWYYLKKSRRLERLGRITTWDMRGAGRSGKPPTGDYALDALARDLREVIESEGARRVVLAGQGLGGLVVLAYCRLFPDQLGRRVAGLILADAPLLPLPAPPTVLRLVAALSPVVGLVNRLVYSSGLGHLATALAAFGGRESRGQLDLVTRSAAFTRPSLALQEAVAMSGFDPRPVLSALTVPVLLISGERSRLVRPADLLATAGGNGSATAVVLPHSGSLSLLERSGEFEQRLREWLEGLPGGPGGRHTQRRREREAERHGEAEDAEEA
ncbi:MAG TPA: alpha/beta fold hydrolase, partial [Chloroflexota bacterium]|nr:alpha/beta fold hydrolase [Chloroflexota bacterium]